MSIRLEIVAANPQELLTVLAELRPEYVLAQQVENPLDSATDQRESTTLDDTTPTAEPEPPAKRRGRKPNSQLNSQPAQTAAPSGANGAAVPGEDSDRDEPPIEGIEVEDDDVTRNAIIESVTSHFMSGDTARRELIAKFKTDNAIPMIRDIAPAQFGAAKALLAQLDALAGV